MLSRLALVALLPMIAVTPALAQSILLSGGDVLNVEDGRILQQTDILVIDGLIAEIGLSGSLTTGDDIELVDMKGATLLPGLMDAHVHLTSGENDNGYAGLAVSLPRATVSGVANAEKTLKAGFTTVRNVGAPGYSDVALRDAVNDGEILGPRIIPAGVALGITGGHCDNNLLPFEYDEVGEGVADGPWAVRAKVRQNVKYGAEVIKFCGTGGVLSKGTKIGAQQFTAEEMDAIVDEAHALGVKVAVHAHGAKGIRTAIEAGVDSVEHSSLIDDASIDLAIARGTYLSMDIYVSDFILSEGEKVGILPESLAKERQVGQAQRERFQVAVNKGAKIAFGTDAGVYPNGLNGRQFAYMVRWGMTPLQAIQAATINTADLFGLSDQIGTLSVGKTADIIAVSSSPLDNVDELEDVDFVMKSGQVVVNKL